jgi:hypothetical protein
VVTLQFCNGHDDLEGCLSVIAISYPSQDSITVANECSGLYVQQANVTMAHTWSDLLDGKKSRALQLPTEWFQVGLVLGAHLRLLQNLLGKQHPLHMGILHSLEQNRTWWSGRTLLSPQIRYAPEPFYGS